ncbi:MAG: hypothetical protein ACPG05_01155 [Bdellovibrionales bacterium]
MIFHSISGVSNVSAECAVGSAISSATTAFGKESKSIHLVLSHLIKTVDGWKAIMKVVVEPNLSISQRAKQHHNLKIGEKDIFAPDFSLEEDQAPLGILLDLPLEKNRKLREHTLPFPDAYFSRNVKPNTPFTPSNTELNKRHFRPLMPKANQSPYTSLENEKAKHFIANNITKPSPKFTRKKTSSPSEENTHHLFFTYIHIPSQYQGLYLSLSALTAKDKRTYVHILEMHIWRKVLNCFLDISFYEATHRATFEKHHTSSRDIFLKQEPHINLNKKLANLEPDIKPDTKKS